MDGNARMTLVLLLLTFGVILPGLFVTLREMRGIKRRLKNMEVFAHFHRGAEGEAVHMDKTRNQPDF